MQKYSVLILGSGGREHTLAWKIAQSPLIGKLYIAPGNGGTSQVAENIKLNLLDFISVSQFIIKEKIDILVVGPEEPLVKGITDFLKKEKGLEDLIIVGPCAAGAMLEGSKVWSKQFMQKYNIPTAQYRSFGTCDADSAFEFLKTLNPPYVIKASGLAAGKGVIITDDINNACNSVSEMLNGSFGDAGKELVIEEFLDGIEVSVFVLTDGINYALLPEAKDYKRIGDDNTGPNTGGMGAVSPVPFADNAFMDKVKKRIISPTIQGLRKEGIDYMGFVFFGLINVGGDPFVIEYNVRMGDPETQAVMPRLKSDLLEMIIAMKNNRLDTFRTEVSDNVSLAVVMASGGYPAGYEKGYEIKGIESVNGSFVFHAGTSLKDGKPVTSGGRVLAVTSMAGCLECARKQAYESIEKIQFNNRYFRKDIGKDIM
jgi:phosphoribosylamine---glycine ligase